VTAGCARVHSPSRSIDVGEGSIAFLPAGRPHHSPSALRVDGPDLHGAVICWSFASIDANHNDENVTRRHLAQVILTLVSLLARRRPLRRV
jgi:hypothetical protein